MVPGVPLEDGTNPKADWYVWGDDDHRWSEARIIFVDTESVQLDLGPASGGSTTGTASSTTSPT